MDDPMVIFGAHRASKKDQWREQMSPRLKEAKREGPGWKRTRKQVLRRDDYTCQRCGHKSGPHAGDDGRVLQAHHIEKVSDGGSNKLSNLRTLCRPCHGVQHPGNDVFDDERGQATVFPDESADDAVAYVNSEYEREPLEDFLERKDSGYCVRCGNPPNDSVQYLYPTLNLSKSDNYTHPGEEFDVLCGPCVGLVSQEDDDNVADHVLSTEGESVGSDIAELQRQSDKAALSPLTSSDKLSVSRDAVNRKEWFLFESPYQLIHGLWRRLATVSLACILFLAGGPLMQRIISYLATDISGIGPASAWFFVFTGGLISALVLALVIRWSIVGLTNRLWLRFDETMQPDHYQRAAGFTLRRRLGRVWNTIGAKYCFFAGLQLVFLAI